jgi:hypothetical protein
MGDQMTATTKNAPAAGATADEGKESITFKGEES